GWQRADAVAALGVALFVFHAGYDMGKRTIEVLVDAAPEGVAEEAARIARSSPGVVRVDRVRARPAGNMVFVEVGIRVSRTLALSRVAAIKQEVANRIRLGIDKAQPLIHTKAIALDSESISDTVRVVAAARSLSVHNIDVRDVGSQRHVDLEIEVDDRLTINDAHEQASGLERAIGTELGNDVIVVTHIEPRTVHTVEGSSLDLAVLTRIEALVHDIAVTLPSVVGVHRVLAQDSAEGICLSFHCLFEEHTPVRKAHDATARFEYLIREKMPALDRIVVHAEPTDHQD
ncbi:MAG: cation transporter, partial [Alphaproteobacteria bacterium]|nr:cation transporter [Alphaproteobacteria bacterium]